MDAGTEVSAPAGTVVQHHEGPMMTDAPESAKSRGEEVASVAAAKPKKSGPNAVRKRTAEYQMKRDARRRAEWAKKKEADTLNILGDDTSPGASNIQGGRGLEPQVAIDGFSENPRVVPYNGGTATYIVDSEQRLVLYRGYTGRGTEAANTAALAAATYLSSNVSSKTYYFMLCDEGVTYPSLRTHFSGNIEIGLHGAGLLQPLLRLVNDIFWLRFPDLYARCVKTSTLRFVLDEDGTLRAPPTFPFAAFALTVGDTVPEPPIDRLAFQPGLKCIVPFGAFHHQKGIRLGMAEAGVEVEHALAPGGMRGSVVLWTNGPLF